MILLLTDSIYQNAGEYEVEYVKHGPTSKFDEVGDVRKGVGAARVEDAALDGLERLQLELAVLLVVG